jgi:hypothetical protein
MFTCQANIITACGEATHCIKVVKTQNTKDKVSAKKILLRSDLLSLDKIKKPNIKETTIMGI